MKTFYVEKVYGSDFIAPIYEYFTIGESKFSFTGKWFISGGMLYMEIHKDGWLCGYTKYVSEKYIEVFDIQRC